MVRHAGAGDHRTDASDHPHSRHGATQTPTPQGPRTRRPRACRETRLAAHSCACATTQEGVSMRPRKNNTHRRDVLQRWARERHNNVAATRHDRAGVYQGPQRFNPAPVRERREHGRRVVCANVASGGQGSVRTWTTCPSHIVAHPAALVGQEGRRLMAGKRALRPHPTAKWRARRDGTRVNASGSVQHEKRRTHTPTVDQHCVGTG